MMTAGCQHQDSNCCIYVIIREAGMRTKPKHLRGKVGRDAEWYMCSPSQSACETWESCGLQLLEPINPLHIQCNLSRASFGASTWVYWIALAHKSILTNKWNIEKVKLGTWEHRKPCCGHMHWTGQQKRRNKKFAKWLGQRKLRAIHLFWAHVRLWVCGRTSNIGAL